MNDESRQKLQAIIRKYGRELYKDARRCESLIRDHCGGATLEMNLLILALKQQVPADLLDPPPGFPPPLLLIQVQKRLQENLGMADAPARWTVESWALALEVVAQSDLQGQAVNDCERNGLLGEVTDDGTDQPAKKVDNPYLDQIDDILLALSKPSSIPPSTSSHDTRINEINRRLSTLHQLPSSQAHSCPTCGQATLNHVTGEATDRCPLCRKGVLTYRDFEAERCPICRMGQMIEHRTRRCYICRNRSLEEEGPRLLVSKDAFWTCSGCRAYFQVLVDGRARLIAFHQDPYGAGLNAKGRTITAEGWQRIAGPVDHYWECNLCSARLDDADDGRLRLTRFTTDPYEVGKRFSDKFLLRLCWAKLAQGLPLTAGNCFCPQCSAEFNSDSSKQTLELLGLGSGNSNVWEAWRGRVFSVATWQIAASGKRSLYPGWLCPACRAEFDGELAELKAVWMPSGPLSAFLNLTWSLDEWYRRAIGAPTFFEAKQLQEERDHLQRLKQQEQAEVFRTRRENLARLEAELQRLMKQTIVDGFHPLPLDSVQISLREDETLHWEGAGLKLKQKTLRGNTFWETEFQGTVLVTSERIILDSPPHNLWQRPLSKLLRVDQQHLQEGLIIVLWFDGLQKPVGICVEDVQFSVTVKNQTRTLKLDTSDLVQLLKTRAKKAK